jgi:hypothetical protein
MMISAPGGSGRLRSCLLVAVPPGRTQTQPMTNYYLRNISPTLWKKVKKRADREGQTIRSVLLRALIAFSKLGR